MRWLVGLDLRERSRGAAHLACWLAAASRAGGDEVRALHVLEEEHLRMLLRWHHLDEVVAGARRAAEEALGAEGLAARIHEVEVARGADAEGALEEAAAAWRADALVVGRAAGREGRHLVRLGRVARRLLRAPGLPVLVAPPDLREEHLGSGPVAALTDLGEGSAAACRFAARLAERLGRPLAVAHAVPRPEDFAAPYLPGASVGELARAGREEGERALAGWLDAEGLRPAATALLRGPAVEAGLSWAEAERAPLVVVGTRRLSALERVAVASVSTELAAVSPIPVAVVPPAEP